MKMFLSITASLLMFVTAMSQPRIVADCTITYAISADETTDKDVNESLKASTKTVYMRGNESRTDLVSPSFTQSLLYSKTTGSAVILREFGNNKFMTKLDAKAWATENKKYDGMTVSLANSETKTILGYESKKIKYTATKINLSPVQASRFDIPTSGYRLLN